MNSKRLRVAVVGNSRWCARIEKMMALSALDVRHLYPDEEAILRQRSVTDWLNDGRVWGYDLIHCIGWFTFWSLWVAARLRRKPTIHHWIGSDVFALCQAGYRGHVAGRLLNRLVGCHLAVADHLVVELGRQGVKATQHLHGLDDYSKCEATELPRIPTGLVYLTETRFEFYGGPIILNLARRFPEVRWLVVGHDGSEVASLPNVSWLGWVANINDVYSDSSFLVRLPRHDGSPNMIREALARGRRVIWNHELPHCVLATNEEEAAQALSRLIGLREPSHQASRWVREEFSVEGQVAKLGNTYRQVADRRHE